MRKIVPGVLALAVIAVNIVAGQAPVEPKRAPEPTAEQLAAAIAAYAKHGAEYTCLTDLQTKQAIHRFKMPDDAPDAKLKDLPDLPFGFGLNLSDTKVTDAGLKELKGLKNLTYLDVNDLEITDAGMKEIKELKNLKTLDLHDTKVTDAGMKEIKELKNLTTLYLQRTKVTNDCLQDLKELQNLTWLGLSETEVTDEGVKQLQQALPKCKIVK